MRIGENVERFGQSPAFCPVDRVEAEIISLLGIGAGLNQLLNDMRVAEDYRKNEWSLAATRTFIDVSATGK